jgi:hypothetical protein
VAGVGGNMRGKNAFIQMWICKKSGKVAPLTVHINELLDVYTLADPTNIRNAIRTKGSWRDHNYEKVGST